MLASHSNLYCIVFAGFIFVGGCAADIIQRRNRRLNNPDVFVSAESTATLSKSDGEQTASPLAMLIAIKQASDSVNNNKQIQSSIDINADLRTSPPPSVSPAAQLSVESIVKTATANTEKKTDSVTTAVAAITPPPFAAGDDSVNAAAAKLEPKQTVVRSWWQWW